MRVLLVGAYGFIGRALAMGLLAAGHALRPAGRDLALGRRLIPGADWVFADFNTMRAAEDWRPLLQGVDAIVNCAGILDATLKDSHSRVHIEGPKALFAAAQAVGTKRIIQISATGTGGGQDSAYSKAKAEGDAALMAMDLDWVILKPSLVIAPGTHGGTQLMRALAGLPFAMPLVGGGQHLFQPVGIADLVRTVIFCLRPDAPARLTLEVAGPAPMTLAAIMRQLRGWLGFDDVPILPVPALAARPLLYFGDLAGWLGMKSAFRSAALRQLEIGNSADPMPLQRLTGEAPQSLDAVLAAAPATLADRLQARAALPMLLLRLGLGLFWVATGAITLLPKSFAAAEMLVARLPLPTEFAAPLTALGAMTDILLGLMMLLGPAVRRVGLLMILVTLLYLIAATMAAPALWLDPLGPLVKALPILLATLAVIAYQEKR